MLGRSAAALWPSAPKAERGEAKAGGPCGSRSGPQGEEDFPERTKKKVRRILTAPATVPTTAHETQTLQVR
ncbi:MAG: hypothetical protein QOD77_1136 [Thermoplasmata archaeon]|jgi:hypothetical protein|nr:hypothetical protein [Thermoplasmata archaeon]